jgi:hypothetical protein
MTPSRRGALLGVLAALWAWPGAAQAVDEVSLLRDATLLEAAGQYPAAESVLVKLTVARPASAPALLALERVLRQQRRIEELPGHVERGLRHEPRSAVLNQLLIRTYLHLDRPAELDAAATAWLEAAPDSETAYREVARAWESRGDYARARQVLEAGREAMDRPDALALELGALYAALGQDDRAAGEWDRAIGPDGRAARQVRRLMSSLPDGGAVILPDLVTRLAGDRNSDARLSAALDIALAGGLEEAVVAVAERLAARLDAAARGRMLLDLARRADGAGLERVARRAYGELVAGGGELAVPAVRARHAELTAKLAANPSQEPWEPASAGDGRAAAALRIEVMAGQDPHEAARTLTLFRDAHPQAPELDRLAGAVATALMARGDVTEAEALVAGVRGPRSELVRARLALARGERDRARAAYLRAAPSLGGAEATRTLSLAALLARVSDAAAEELGRAMSDVAVEDTGRALDRLMAAADQEQGDQRAAVLDFAARLADAASLEGDATRLRRIIVADHPRAREAPDALLALARSVPAEACHEARELLERLILEYPRSALVPQARRELERLRRAQASRPNQIQPSCS